jgi:hypothetical protein
VVLVVGGGFLGVHADGVNAITAPPNRARKSEKTAEIRQNPATQPAGTFTFSRKLHRSKDIRFLRGFWGCHAKGF